MSEGEFQKRTFNSIGITQQECNYSCRLDDKKFPQPNRQQLWVKIEDIDEARKDFPKCGKCKQKDCSYYYQRGTSYYICPPVQNWVLKWLGARKKC